MRVRVLGAAALAAARAAGPAQAAPAVTGEYVESRSANVYVGACHREGELFTVGREAVLAWNVTGGDYRGVSLKGVTAVAVVAADKNLELQDGKRRSVLFISDRATPAQREAFVALLKERAAGAIGELAAVRSAPVSFDGRADMFQVRVDGAADLRVKKQTGELCCKQPYELWGKPLVPVKNARAGYCVGVEYRDSGLLRSWKATDQNNAYFGEFSL